MSDRSGCLKSWGWLGNRTDLWPSAAQRLISATDSAIANAGNWEGEVELYNNSGVIVEQTESFSFVIEESY